MLIATYAAIIVFFVICFLYGITMNFFFRFTSVFTEKLYKLMACIVAGFGVIPLVIVTLGLLRIPMNVWFFLFIGLPVPLYWLFKHKKEKKDASEEHKSYVYQIVILILLAVFFFLMIKGTFSYPWLEDDDPWNYAAGAKYVAVQKDYHAIQQDGAYAFYLFPSSPPITATLIGLLHQITPDLYAIMKIFINLCLLIGVTAFFLFCLVFSGKNQLFSVIATAILLIAPSFAGHFIFNYTLSVCLFLAFLFALSLVLNEKKAVLLAGIMCASVIITHPITGLQAAVVLFILFIIYLIRDIRENQSSFSHFIKNFFKKHSGKIILIGVFGLIFSLLFIADLFMQGNIASRISERIGGKNPFISLNSGSSLYDIEDKNLQDFFIAKKQSRMDQEEGIGIFLFSICLLGIVLAFFVKDLFKKNNIIFLVLFLFYFLFLWIFTGGIFKFSVQNYRWWSILAVFVALHAAATIILIIKKLKPYPSALFLIIIGLCVGLYITSAVPRYSVQMSAWPPGAIWSSYEEVNGYSSLRNLGTNKLFLGVCNAEGRKIIANNQLELLWDSEVYDYLKYVKNQSIAKNSTEIISKINRIIELKKIQYITIDAGCISYFGQNTTNELASYYSTKQGFKTDRTLSNNAFILIQTNNY